MAPEGLCSPRWGSLQQITLAGLGTATTAWAARRVPKSPTGILYTTVGPSCKPGSPSTSPVQAVASAGARWRRCSHGAFGGYREARHTEPQEMGNSLCGMGVGKAPPGTPRPQQQQQQPQAGAQHGSTDPGVRPPSPGRAPAAAPCPAGPSGPSGHTANETAAALEGARWHTCTAEIVQAPTIAVEIAQAHRPELHAIL